LHAKPKLKLIMVQDVIVLQREGLVPLGPGHFKNVACVSKGQAIVSVVTIRQ
jgi:hypothetical protein